MTTCFTLEALATRVPNVLDAAAASGGVEANLRNMGGENGAE
jgi:hypothetical protein